MTPFRHRLLRSKGRLQTTMIMRKYRARVWWGVDLWTEAELRAAWGDR
jgi:hypothetical protein